MYGLCDSCTKRNRVRRFHLLCPVARVEDCVDTPPSFLQGREMVDLCKHSLVIVHGNFESSSNCRQHRKFFPFSSHVTCAIALLTRQQGESSGELKLLFPYTSSLWFAAGSKWLWLCSPPLRAFHHLSESSQGACSGCRDLCRCVAVVPILALPRI